MVAGDSLSKNKGGKLHNIWSNGKETSLTVIHNAGYVTWGDLHLQVKELGWELIGTSEQENGLMKLPWSNDIRVTAAEPKEGEMQNTL